MMRPFVLASLSAMLCAAPLTAQNVSARAVRHDVKDGYNLTFVEADVRRVVDAVLGSMLSLEYSVDPSVQGNVTLRTNEPVAREALLPLLEATLRSVDAVIVVQGKSYRVIPRNEARNRGGFASSPMSAEAVQAGYITEAIVLRHGSAREMARVLEQVLGKDAVAGIDTPRNQILISGSSDERLAARQLIERFDVDTLANMSFEFYKLENVDATTLRAELERIFQPPFDIIGSRIRIIPIPRLRSILAIAADRGDLIRIEAWIRRLDAGASGKRKLYNYAVQNGRARDLAASLQAVLGGMNSPNGEASQTGIAQTSLSSENGELGIGDIMSDQPIGAQQGAANSAISLPSLTGGSPSGPRIVPNDHNNSLLIYADGEEYGFIREALEKLDQPVSQVLIEATLAEVTLTDDFRFGVNFRATSGDGSITNTSSESGAPAPIFPGFSLNLIDSSVNAILNTLQSKTNVRVLSAPKLIVLNNQTAMLQVGDQVPVITQQSQGTGAPGAPIINSVELRDTGVILKVTPRVNDSGTITLDIAQEVSDVAETTTSGINSPTIQQRRLSSTVSTRTGQMVALGGLIRDRNTVRKSGIPILSQVPIVGGLFGSQSDGGTRTELIILLTPTIIRSPDEVRAMVDALVDGLDAARPLVDLARERQVGGRTRSSE